MIINELEVKSLIPQNLKESEEFFKKLGHYVPATISCNNMEELYLFFKARLIKELIQEGIIK